MDHCWHTIILTINHKAVPMLRCCFCGTYEDMPTKMGEKVSWAGHGKYAPGILRAFPPYEECPNR